MTEDKDRYVVLRATPRPAPSAHTVETAKRIAREVTLEHGTHPTLGIWAVPDLVTTIDNVMLGALGPVQGPEYHSARVVCWYLSGQLAVRGVSLSPAGINKLHDGLNALLHGNGAPLIPR